MEAEGLLLDIISNVPSTMLQTILDFLPIRDAFRGSVFSQRWRYDSSLFQNERASIFEHRKKPTSIEKVPGAPLDSDHTKPSEDPARDPAYDPASKPPPPEQLLLELEELEEEEELDLDPDPAPAPEPLPLPPKPIPTPAPTPP